MTEDNRTAVNIGNAERLVSGLIGGWMLSRGLAKHSSSGILLAGTGIALVYRAATGRSRLYRNLHISGSEQGRRSSAAIPYQTGLKIEQRIAVAKPAEEVYRFWREPENLPRFMTHVQSVVPAGPKQWHWTAGSLVARALEWDSELINDQPNTLIGWQSLPESPLRHAGSVTFRELGDGRGTEVKLTLEYRPAGGPLGAGIAYLLGQNPRRQIAQDLRRFKELMETGGVATSQ
jgi:uncharacterized membrane protein